MPRPRARIDRYALEVDYRSGMFTGPELAAKYGISRQAIQKAAKKHGWSVDHRQPIAAATQSLVDQAEVRGLRARAGVERRPMTHEERGEACRQERIRERTASAIAQSLPEAARSEIVLALATVNADVILGHRLDIAKARQLTQTMLDEIAAATLRPEEFAALFEVAATDLEGQELAGFRKRVRTLLSLPERIDGVGKLTRSIIEQQAAERTALGLDKQQPEPPKPPTIDEVKRLPPEEAYRAMVQGVRA